MPKILSVHSGGIRTLNKGHVVGVIYFDVTMNESAPERIVGYCIKEHQEKILDCFRHELRRCRDEHRYQAYGDQEGGIRS